ncbi:MAG TPA: nuclear transport factor 2 family protein [Opitutus sp.]|nr:nuclear transport factor 2 family protein [Opitutus sp.]
MICHSDRSSGRRPCLPTEPSPNQPARRPAATARLLLLRLAALLPLILLTPLRAADADDFAAVRRADQQRIVATIAADTAKLAPLLSDDLRYARADGQPQTKAELLAAVTGSRIKYVSVVPQDLAFQAIAPGAVAMSGNARLAVVAREKHLEFTLHFLAVWRNESGHWRLLAYQSSPPAAAPTP